MSYRILVIDDEQIVRSSLAAYLEDCGHRVMEAVNGSEGIHIVVRERPDVVFTDIRMPVMDGFRVVETMSAEYPEIPVIVVSGVGGVREAVQALHLGAWDYITKPVEDLGVIDVAIRRVMEKVRFRLESDALKGQLLEPEQNQAFGGLVTCSDQMRRIFRYLTAVATSGQALLICGETGTGKELVARAVHAASGRSGQFVAVNLAGIDDQMFSDTLFGHLRGAFTGASEKREGLVARAAGGTLFLDEIGDLSESSQVKLLRLLQEGEYFPLGSDVARTSQVRVVVATHRDLNELQRQGLFRADLYYRLKTHQVNLPPVRERREDIPLLLAHLLAEASASLKKEPPTPPPELVAYLQSYHFPGNVRELKAMVYDAVAQHGRGVLSMESFISAMGAQSLPVSAAVGPVQLQYPDGRIPTLKEAEESLISQALALSCGNQGVAARYLGITRQALNKRLNRAS